MIWYLVAVLVVVVLGVVAAAAAGRVGTMPEAFDDRVDSRLPLGRLSEADVANVRLPVAVRGYRMSEVDRLLDVLGAQLREQQAELDALRAHQPSNDQPPNDQALSDQLPSDQPSTTQVPVDRPGRSGEPLC